MTFEPPEKFEKYLLTKKQFLKDMLLISKVEDFSNYYAVQLDVIEDIIHHFNVLVKGEKSSGLGTENG